MSSHDHHKPIFYIANRLSTDEHVPAPDMEHKQKASECPLFLFFSRTPQQRKSLYRIKFHDHFSNDLSTIEHLRIFLLQKDVMIHHYLLQNKI